MSQSVGIDISKDTLDVSVFDTQVTFSCPNNPEGHKKILKELTQLHEPLVVIEPSGGYEYDIHRALDDADVRVALVNARLVHWYGKYRNQKAKTDRIDAGLLARYGAECEPDIRPLRSRKHHQRKKLALRRQQLTDDLAKAKTRLKQADGEYAQSLEREIEFLKEERDRIEKHLEKSIADDEQLQVLRERLQTVPGVGPTLSATLVTLLPELGLVSHKKIAALVGVAPYNRDSGQMEGPRHIADGRKRIRTVLYMATVRATSCNPVIQEFYQRLIGKGKPAKVALVACMHKLLRILNAMARDNTPWLPKTA